MYYAKAEELLTTAYHTNHGPGDSWNESDDVPSTTTVDPLAPVTVPNVYTWEDIRDRCTGSLDRSSDWLCETAADPAIDPAHLHECGIDDYKLIMHMGSCYSYDDCWSEGQKYYYEGPYSTTKTGFSGGAVGASRLACGWAYSREWPTTRPERNEGRCIEASKCINY